MFITLDIDERIASFLRRRREASRKKLPILQIMSDFENSYASFRVS